VRPGSRQLLDIGTGIPAAGNTHQVAHEVAPDSLVVYVEYGHLTTFFWILFRCKSAVELVSLMTTAYLA
jgi:hypothetical protein